MIYHVKHFNTYHAWQVITYVLLQDNAFVLVNKVFTYKDVINKRGTLVSHSCRFIESRQETHFYCIFQEFLCPGVGVTF